MGKVGQVLASIALGIAVGVATAGVGAFVGGAIGGALFGTAVGTTIGTFVGYVGFMAGSTIGAGLLTPKHQKTTSSASPTYGFGSLQTQSSNQLCIPIVYGRVKLAGNVIWQLIDTSDSSILYKVIAFADGEINQFTDVKINDIAINASVAGSSTNLITNGSFEIDLTGWTTSSDITASKSNTWSTVGSYSMKLEATSVNGGYVYNTITVKANTKYKIAFNIYRKEYGASKFSSANAHLQLNILSGSDSVYTSDVSNAKNNIFYDTETQFYEFEINTLNSTSLTIKYTFSLASFVQPPIFFIDNVSLIEIGSSNELSGCSYTQYIGTTDQLIDNRVTGATQADKSLFVGGLKNTAYLGVTAKASEKVNSNYTITTYAEGSKLRVYSTTTYYTVAYSNNPIWCLLDFLCRYNGCGLGLSATGDFDDTTITNNFDIQSFIDAAEICDYIITTDGVGTVNTTAGSRTVTGTGTSFNLACYIGCMIVINGETRIVSSITDDTNIIVDSAFTNINNDVSFDIKQPRFTFNMALDERKSNIDWLDEILRCCRGYWYYQNGKIGVKIEEDEAAVQSFDESSIIAGSIVSVDQSLENLYDIVKIKYIDQNNNNAAIFAQAEYVTFDHDPPIVKELECYGVTNFNQASRLAWFYLNLTKTCKNVLTFKVSKSGLDRTIGDVINVTAFNFTNKKFRIITMAESSDGLIELTCKEHNSSIYVDTVGSQAPVINIVNAYSDLSAPPNILTFQVSQNQAFIEFLWQEPASELTYEIREGSSWDNASIVATKLSGFKYTATGAQIGTKYYYIKAINKKGVYSDTAKLCAITITDINSNVVVTDDLISDYASATLTNCFVSQSRLIPNASVNWANIGNWSNTGQYYEQLDNNWGANVIDGAIYESKVYDLGVSLNSNISVNYNLFSISTENSLTIEWKYSVDNVTWTDYATFNAGTYEFIYYKFKITINSPNNLFCSLNQFYIIVDVPDLIQSGNSTSSVSGDTTITFDKTYYIVPKIVATIENAANGDFVKYTNVTVNSFDYSIYNGASRVSKTIHWHSMGY